MMSKKVAINLRTKVLENCSVCCSHFKSFYSEHPLNTFPAAPSPFVVPLDAETRQMTFRRKRERQIEQF